MEGDEKQDDIEPKACVCACGHFDFGIFLTYVLWA